MGGGSVSGEQLLVFFFFLLNMLCVTFGCEKVKMILIFRIYDIYENICFLFQVRYALLNLISIHEVLVSEINLYS